jgi:hypothetical protein
MQDIHALTDGSGKQLRRSKVQYRDVLTGRTALQISGIELMKALNVWRVEEGPVRRVPVLL